LVHIYFPRFEKSGKPGVHFKLPHLSLFSPQAFGHFETIPSHFFPSLVSDDKRKEFCGSQKRALIYFLVDFNCSTGRQCYNLKKYFRRKFGLNNCVFRLKQNTTMSMIAE
jgi:hypothetical protein